MAESHYSVDSARHFQLLLLSHPIDFKRITGSRDEPSALAVGLSFLPSPSRH
jgi:hypothetical protein